jgi:hypothetical protein
MRTALINRRDAETQRGIKNSQSLLFSASLRLCVEKGFGNWLPDMDLNHDKVIQSHLCYRYTIGQAGALRKLDGFNTQSSRQSGGADENECGIYACPHPRGEGEMVSISVRLNRFSLAFASGHKIPSTCDCNNRYQALRQRIFSLPLRGERAGVRAGIIANRKSKI